MSLCILPWRHWGKLEIWHYPYTTSALDWGGWSAPLSGRFNTREGEPVPIVQEAGRVRKISPPTKVRTPDRPSGLTSVPLLSNYLRQSYRLFTDRCNCRLLSVLPCSKKNIIFVSSFDQVCQNLIFACQCKFLDLPMNDLGWSWPNCIAVRFVTLLAQCAYVVINSNSFHVCLKYWGSMKLGDLCAL